MFKKLSLTWKINFTVALIILLILSVIAFVIYNYSIDILLDQVNDKIEIMSNYQKKLLNEIMERKNKEIDKISNNSIISLYTDFAYYIKLNEQSDSYNEKNSFGNYTFKELISSSTLVRQTGTKLKSMINDIEYASLAYITDP